MSCCSAQINIQLSSPTYTRRRRMRVRVLLLVFAADATIPRRRAPAMLSSTKDAFANQMNVKVRSQSSCCQQRAARRISLFSSSSPSHSMASHPPPLQCWHRDNNQQGFLSILIIIDYFGSASGFLLAYTVNWG